MRTLSGIVTPPSTASNTALAIANGVPGTGCVWKANGAAANPGGVVVNMANMTNERVELIKAQSNYQANAKTISTESTILKTLIQMTCCRPCTEDQILNCPTNCPKRWPKSARLREVWAPSWVSSATLSTATAI